MPRPTRPVLMLGAFLYALGEWAYRVGDALFDIPPGVEARHYIWRD